MGRCIAPRHFVTVACQSRGGLCRNNLHPVCQAQMEHDMNINDVPGFPGMMLCPNCLRRVAGDQWNDDEAAAIPLEAIMRDGAWRGDGSFSKYLSN